MHRYDFIIHSIVAKIYYYWYCFSGCCCSWRFTTSSYDCSCLFCVKNVKRLELCKKTCFVRNYGWCKQYLLGQNWYTYDEFDDLDIDLGWRWSRNWKTRWIDSIECPWFYAFKIFLKFIVLSCILQYWRNPWRCGSYWNGYAKVHYEMSSWFCKIKKQISSSWNVKISIWFC